MPISVDVHDLSFFSVVRLKDTQPGDLFLLDGGLAKRFKLNGHQCFGFISGEKPFLFFDMPHGSYWSWGDRKVLVLPSDMKPRIAPKPSSPQEWISTKQEVVGMLLLCDSGPGIAMSGAADRAGFDHPGRVAVHLTDDEGEFHGHEYLSAVHHWTIQWLRDEHVILSITNSPD